MNITAPILRSADENRNHSSSAPDVLPVESQPEADAPVNILLVDDDARNLDVLESILQSPAHTLVRAQTADETLLALIQKDFAAIVLDIQMPGMNGFDLARMIKQRKRNQHIPIIFLTAYFNDSKDVLSGYDVGAVDYLTKPVDSKILKSKVGAFVDLFRTTRALSSANQSLEHEIAERTRVELELSRLAAIVESSSDAILSRNFDGIITSWNSGAERIFGYTAAEIVGRSIAVLIPPGREHEQELGNEDILQGRTVEALETVRLRKDGRPVDVSLTVSPIKAISGQVTSLSCIMRDIGERKRLEGEVLQAAEYEQRRIAQDLHDGLGQQLAGISCLSDTLKKDLEQVNVPQSAAAAKISKLLDVAVAQSRSLARGLYPVISEPNGLMSALEDMALRVTDLFKVRCVFECPEPVWIEDNPAATHLYRIAQEAVTNSVKHGRARNIRIGLSLTSGKVTLKISDDGVGFQKSGVRKRGIGLRIMEYRAGMIGATLVVQPNGAGVDVICTWKNQNHGEASEQDG